MLAHLISLIRLSILTPKEGAATILSFSPGRDILWTALALIAVVSGVLSTLSTYVVPAASADMGEHLLSSPVLFTGVLAGILLLTVICTHYIGRGFGGTGEFNESLLLVAWLQLVLVAVQVVQLGIALVSPEIAQLIGVASLFLFIWLYVNFVAVLHGFASLPMVLVGMMISMFAVGIGLSILLSLIAALLGLEIVSV